MAEKEKPFGKKNWLGQLVGQYSMVIFLDGKKMFGQVLDVTQYEVILKKDSMDSPVIIPKHAIKYLYDREKE